MPLPTFITLILMAVVVIQAGAQEIQLHDLNNNNGYITLKLEDIKVIKNYKKVLHIINITEFEITKDHIKNNILALKPKRELIEPMYSTVNQSLILLEAKIEHMKPHLRQKRGLVNILGKGLKYIAGTMDYEDEMEIKEKLDKLSEYNGKLIKENNKQVIINKEISDQIQNITSHIKNQQRSIEQYLNTYNHDLLDKVTTLEDEMNLIKYIYNLNHDILLLRNHVDDVEQVLFSSSLGLLSRNILTEKELELISYMESYKSIKVAVTFYRDQIIIVLLIPQFSNSIYSKILIEPIPDSDKKSIYLDKNEILVDEYNTAFEFPVKENLKKNLVHITNVCIKNIIKSQEAYCTKQIVNEEDIKEITEGIIITKNLKETNLTQNCNQLNMSISGNYIIKFKNCKIELQNKTFENFETRIYDKIILPNFVTKTKEEKVIQNIKLEELYTKHINNREFIEEVSSKSVTFSTINLGIDFLVITSIIVIIVIKFKKKRKIGKRVDIESISSEPQFNGGGVIIQNPIKPII